MNFLLLALFAVIPLVAQDVLTWHNDNARTGQNLAEIILTVENVNPKTLASCSSFQLTEKSMRNHCIYINCRFLIGDCATYSVSLRNTTAFMRSMQIRASNYCRPGC